MSQSDQPDLACQSKMTSLVVCFSNFVHSVQLDFAIVVVSVIVLALDSLLPGVQWLKGLRVLRALKPLRCASPCCHALD